MDSKGNVLPDSENCSVKGTAGKVHARAVRTERAREQHGVAKASLERGLEVGEGILESVASKVGPEGYTSRVTGQVRRRKRPGPAGTEQVLRPGGEPSRGLPGAWPEHSTPQDHQCWSWALTQRFWQQELLRPMGSRCRR